MLDHSVELALMGQSWAVRYLWSQVIASELETLFLCNVEISCLTIASLALRYEISYVHNGRWQLDFKVSFNHIELAIFDSPMHIGCIFTVLASEGLFICLVVQVRYHRIFIVQLRAECPCWIKFMLTESMP